MSLSFINPVTENSVWSVGKIRRRNENMIESKFSKDDQEYAKRVLFGVDFGEALSIDDANFVGYLSEELRAVRLRSAASKSDNERLGLALGYEQALRDRRAASVLLDGVPEVPEVEAVEGVDAVLDELTGELLTPAIEAVEFAALIPAIEPLALTVESFDEAGEPITIDNPAYITQRDKRDNAQTVIDGASADTLALITEREAHRNED